MNKKSKLLVNLAKKNILIKKGNKIYLKFDSFKLFEIEEVFFWDRDHNDVLILKKDKVMFEYWIKQDLLIPPWHTHWFQLRDNFLLKLNNNLLKILLDRAIKKANNIYKLCEYLEMSTPSFYDVYNNKRIMISVKKFRRLLTYLDIPYTKFNNKIEYTKKGSKISIQNPKFPINLNSEHGAYILGSIVSDGCIYIDKEARGVIRTKYSTSEKESITSFIDSINKIYGKVHIQKEFVRNCETLRIGSSIVGDTLLKIGAILGHKAEVDGNVPWIIEFGSKNLKKHYLQSVFSDEASIYIGKKSYQGYIILSRYKRLGKLTKKQKDKLTRLEKYMSVSKFPTGHINKKIPIKRALEKIKGNNHISILLNSVPNLLLGESKILDDFNIKHRIWSRSLSKTSAGNYSLCCDLFINKKDSIIRFYKEIGFSLSNKQEKLIKLIKFMSNKNGIKTI